MKEIYIKLGIVMVVISIFLFSYSSITHTKIDEKKPEKKTEEVQQKNDEPVMVAVSINDNVENIDLDTYLLGVVAGEMPASFELEALKAQVVASRTFVFRRGLEVDNTTNTQVYLTDEQMRNNWKDEYEAKKAKIQKAIAETKDKVMKYNGDYISALFFSSSNGYTENCNDYFVGDAVPYLQSVESPWDEKIDSNFIRKKTFTTQELKTLFGSDAVDFHIVSHKKSGRVDKITVNGKEYSGREVRELLSLSSSSFTIDVDKDSYTFTCKGSGHGVGMSQYGAQGMALEGYNYEEILHHYYTKVEIVNN